jgi:eukaryotic-like serine/threonine-protein kinase
MSQADADRNLLFGILALQMDFITREGLIAGMNAWVLRKGTPLGQILADQGALAAEHHALLEPLVAAHLKAHGDEPARSLAAAGAAGAIRYELTTVPDADLRDSLAHLGAAGDDTDDDPYRTTIG